MFYYDFLKGKCLLVIVLTDGGGRQKPGRQEKTFIREAKE
jgi:hypothetical protein